MLSGGVEIYGKFLEELQIIGFQLWGNIMERLTGLSLKNLNKSYFLFYPPSINMGRLPTVRSS